MSSFNICPLVALDMGGTSRRSVPQDISASPKFGRFGITMSKTCFPANNLSLKLKELREIPTIVNISCFCLIRIPLIKTRMQHASLLQRIQLVSKFVQKHILQNLAKLMFLFDRED